MGLHSGKFWSKWSCFSGRKRGEWRSTRRRFRDTPSTRRAASITLTWTCLLLCIVQCVGTATVTTTTDGMAGVRIPTRMAHGRSLSLVEPLTDAAEYISKKCLGLPLLGMATECCQEGHTRGKVTGWICSSLSNEEREYLEYWHIVPPVLNYKKDEQCVEDAIEWVIDSSQWIIDCTKSGWNLYGSPLVHLLYRWTDANVAVLHEFEYFLGYKLRSARRKGILTLPL